MRSSADSDDFSAGVAIGNVAQRFGIAPHVLRHWEDEQLLHPGRDAAGRRRYGPDEVVRVAAILASQSAGLSLEQIRTMFDTEATGRRELLEQHLADLERRRAELEVAREVTAHALDCRAHDLTTCPRFRESVGALLHGDPVPEGRHPREWRVTAGDAGAPSSAPGVRGGAARPPRRSS